MNLVKFEKEEVGFRKPYFINPEHVTYISSTGTNAEQSVLKLTGVEKEIHLLLTIDEVENRLAGG